MPDTRNFSLNVLSSGTGGIEEFGESPVQRAETVRVKLIIMKKHPYEESKLYGRN